MAQRTPEILFHPLDVPTLRELCYLLSPRRIWRDAYFLSRWADKSKTVSCQYFTWLCSRPVASQKARRRGEEPGLLLAARARDFWAFAERAAVLWMGRTKMPSHQLGACPIPGKPRHGNQPWPIWWYFVRFPYLPMQVNGITGGHYN